MGEYILSTQENIFVVEDHFYKQRQKKTLRKMQVYHPGLLGSLKSEIETDPFCEKGSNVYQETIIERVVKFWDSVLFQGKVWVVQ